MDTRRLAFVDDVCPLSRPGTLPSFEATHWWAEGGHNLSRVIFRESGFTNIVTQNPLLTWHRTFTKDNRSEQTTSNSLIHIEEWIPSMDDGEDRKRFTIFGVPRHHGIAELPKTGLVRQNWSTHAKRHLKSFEKAGVTLRLGRFDELKKPYSKSKISRAMRQSLYRLTERHVKDHGETIDVLIAETKEDGILAAFVAGNCAEAKTSIYLLGFYLDGGKKTYAMTGLVNWWFERSREKGLALCNFGDMCGPKPLPFSDDLGYSIFKTHFGIRRYALPRSHWRVTFPLLKRLRK